MPKEQGKKKFGSSIILVEKDTALELFDLPKAFGTSSNEGGGGVK